LRNFTGFRRYETGVTDRKRSLSDTIWRLMLELALRDEAVLGLDIHAVEVALARALGTVEMLKRQMVSRRDGSA
jgi:hypothetical protein